MPLTDSVRILRQPRPFYETIDPSRIFLILAVATQAVSLWFVTAGSVRVSSFPPDALYYARQLPFIFWWGLGASIALLLSASLLKSRMRVLVEIFSLFLLSLYVISLSSFVYENPRILDVYVHMSNTLLIVTSQGWVGSTDWYVRQFPGAYTYFAQFIVLAGISPFDLMMYYPVASSWVMVVFIYTIIRWFNPAYAGRMTALSIGGFWFQLHLCPQSLELIPYIGLLFIFVKVVTDQKRQGLWTAVAISTVPVFVVSHPESDAVMILGLAGLILLSRILPSGRKAMAFRTVSKLGLFLAALFGMMLAWWFSFADEARVEIGAIATTALSHALSGHAAPPQTLPTAPAYSYQLAISLEQALAITVWLLGVAFFFLSRARWTAREYPIWGLFLGALSTVIVTFQVRADMLQRSYLFSLLPAVILFGAMMARRQMFIVRGRSLHSIFGVFLVFAMIAFIVLMPVTRNGVDPYEYTPESSLHASSVAAGLTGQSNSVLFLYNGENAWRYYAALYGDKVAIRDEQRIMDGMAGGFTKPNSTVTVSGQVYNIPLTQADRSTHFIILSDFYESLYILRFGEGATYYVGQKGLFEDQVALHFNLVYTTGTDRIYSNPNPPSALVLEFVITNL